MSKDFAPNFYETVELVDRMPKYKFSVVRFKQFLRKAFTVVTTITTREHVQYFK